MASKVVRAVPDVIDCDRVTLLLDDGGLTDSADRKFRVMSSFGYSDEVAASLAGRVFSARDMGVDSEYGLVERTHFSLNDVATVSAPIAIDGATIGFIVAGVESDPGRLAVTPRLAERLKGLAAQAAIAINNARLVDQIRYQAVHDTLTGLPNRALIIDRIDQMLARTRRDDHQVAALFVDLDGFKEVNDTLGHGAGDHLLKAVAKRLSTVMRESDGIGRIGRRRVHRPGRRQHDVRGARVHRQQTSRGPASALRRRRGNRRPWSPSPPVSASPPVVVHRRLNCSATLTSPSTRPRPRGRTATSSSGSGQATTEPPAPGQGALIGPPEQPVLPASSGGPAGTVTS